MPDALLRELLREAAMSFCMGIISGCVIATYVLLATGDELAAVIFACAALGVFVVEEHVYGYVRDALLQDRRGA